MTESHQISETFRRVVAHDRKFPYKDYSHPDSSWVISAANFLENCFPGSVLVLCKIKHPEIAYVSRNCEAIIGYSSQHLKGTTPEEYFKLVHPEDRSSVIRLYERMEEHTKATDYLPENWKFAFHYRLRLKNEKYIYIRDEKAAFLHSSNQYIHYSILSVQENPGTIGKPYMALRKKFNYSFRNVDVYVPKTSTGILTRREQEVLKCLEAGLSTKEIANTLSISPYTIRNHKTSLFKKTKAKTGLQALKNAREMQWI